MGIFSKLSLVKDAAEGVADVTSKVTSGIADIKRVKEGDVAARDEAVQKSYQNEFVKENRTTFDVLMDCLNRTVRPVMAYLVVVVVVVYVVRPEWGSKVSTGFSTIPSELWWIIGSIITFYFGGRILEKNKRK